MLDKPPRAIASASATRERRCEAMDGPGIMEQNKEIVRQFIDGMLNQGHIEAAGLDGKIKDTRIIMDALGIMARLASFAPRQRDRSVTAPLP